MLKTRLTILFAGMIAADPHQGGATWAVLQYLLGLKELGHEVVFVEPISAAAIRPARCRLQDSLNAEYFREVAADFAFADRAALLLDGTRETGGIPYDLLRAFAGRADVLLNVSGMLADQELIRTIPLRVYLDLDPGFVQLWHATQGIDMRFEGHTHFATVGLSIGTPFCDVPTCGRDWLTTLQPIVLTHWPRARVIRYNALTTVGNWRGYGSVEHDGRFYGQKAHSLRELMALPKVTAERFLLAMAIHPDEVSDLTSLSENGWDLVDPLAVAGTPSLYREFVQHSKGEFGVAKSGYVKSRCGWFSDRSICYLASGRPVIAQDTGFSQHLPVGEGLLPFETIDDAVDCISTINSDYVFHSRAARTLAETCFSSDRVLNSLLQRVGAIS
jgi:hypothetical protein